MAAKKNKESSVPVSPKPEEKVTEPEVMPEEKAAGPGNTPSFQIRCCSPISKSFGGVTFVNGVAETTDGFTASWFGNKKGYTVTEVRKDDSKCTGSP